MQLAFPRFSQTWRTWRFKLLDVLSRSYATLYPLLDPAANTEFFCVNTCCALRKGWYTQGWEKARRFPFSGGCASAVAAGATARQCVLEMQRWALRAAPWIVCQLSTH